VGHPSLWPEDVVEILPGFVLEDFYFGDGMNFPEGEAVFVQVIVVIGIEHQPAGDTDGDVRVAIFGENSGCSSEGEI
jgi:hypothetical protein